VGGYRRMSVEEVPSLAVGAVLGDSDRKSMAWSRAIGALSTEVKARREGVDSPVKVNVVFHVDGRVAPNDFVGVRTGRFDKRRSRLVVQAAVSGEPIDDPRAVLLPLLWDAIDEAELFVVRRRLAEGLPEIRRIAASLAQGS
jgi:hypothetical protein